MKMQKALIVLVFISSIIYGRNDKLFISGNNYAEKNVRNKEARNLDSYYSEKQLGSYVENGKTHFALFTPNAEKVILVVFNQPEELSGHEYEMQMDSDGVWEAEIDGELYGKFYGYKVYHKNEDLSGNKPVCVDPYAKAVATYNTYMNPRLSIVYKNDYDWENDEWIQRDWRDLVIYEMHVRDMTAHPSSGSSKPGTYEGLIDENQKGGINYIKDLGVNTVELLPAMEFGSIEIPFKDSIGSRFNTWNPYERNHWGYMTSNFFAPAAYYSENWTELKWNTWMGKSGDQVRQFKDMVKAFHKNNISVMMDVVFNHLSEYEIGNLKEIDREYYFRLNKTGKFIAESGCGNDLKTERPMMRRLIIDSILFWMKEYHVDGFRFDLGKLLDWETIEQIIYEAKKINPNVVIVCEPWGGGYDPKGFSLRGWGAWNDQIRNGIKGENPNNGLGWIFGKWYGNNSRERIKSYVNGTLIRDSLGLFQRKEHSVNYLESHDGYTLGDFIRIGTKEVAENERITDVDANAVLSDYELKLNKLGALFLLTSQGITMIDEGQEFARSKVIPIDIAVPDEHKGMIDHNTYNKDNAVNYINYRHAEMNSDLVNYYKGLIKLREKYEAFRRADYDKIDFIEPEENLFALGYSLKYNNDEFLVLFNADQVKAQNYILPEGDWSVLINDKTAGIDQITEIEDNYIVPPVSGVVLKKID